MEDRSFRRSHKIPSEEQSKEDPLVMPLQSIEVKNSSLGQEDSQDEEEEKTKAPNSKGRTSQLCHILRDAKNFICKPRNKEYSSIMVNNVWEVVSRPQDRFVVGSRWIYKTKCVADGSVENYKASFVAKGYAQKKEIDYEEAFTPVARYTYIRTMISLVAHMGWEIH
eukprot:PITA_10091